MTYKALFVLIFSFIWSSVYADESRLLHVEIIEEANNQYLLKWRFPDSIQQKNDPKIQLSDCLNASPPLLYHKSQITTIQQSVKCNNITGRFISINYPLANPSMSTLIRIIRNNGENKTFMLKPNQDRFEIPLKENMDTVAQEYFILGFDHILSGYDHLLFVLCIMLIASTKKRIFLCISGFTIAHSLTLILVTLSIIIMNSVIVESLIALSIIFLARELLSSHENSLTWRMPIAVSSIFGLLHGFGFASALKEIGLPQTELPISLLSFNIGVEIGQITFVIGMFLVLAIISTLFKYLNLSIENRIYRVCTGSFAGVIASYWVFERIASIST